jgi:hypothetical protein
MAREVGSTPGSGGAWASSAGSTVRPGDCAPGLRGGPPQAAGGGRTSASECMISSLCGRSPAGQLPFPAVSHHWVMASHHRGFHSLARRPSSTSSRNSPPHPGRGARHALADEAVALGGARHRGVVRQRLARAVALGAAAADFQPQDDVRVLCDPVGHPFCLFVAPARAPDRSGQVVCPRWRIPVLPGPQSGFLAMTTTPGPACPSAGSRSSATGRSPACSIRSTSCSGRHWCVVQRTDTPP